MKMSIAIGIPIRYIHRACLNYLLSEFQELAVVRVLGSPQAVHVDRLTMDMMTRRARAWNQFIAGWAAIP
jgi:hypothetical protein